MLFVEQIGSDRVRNAGVSPLSRAMRPRGSGRNDDYHMGR